MHCDFLCLLRQRNGELNSGPKSANIVTDAYRALQGTKIQVNSAMNDREKYGNLLLNKGNYFM